ncbi:MAG: alpha/beta hydrolase [Acidobacteriia bacterium]|nr:alpha/beta hydrolase [Terriglobia bacterium]
MKPAAVALFASLAALAFAKKAPIELAATACRTPPPLHCPDKDCPGPTVIEQGSTLEPKTNRKFFLDYPCDLKSGEKVTFILALHGAGSYGNWQRNYFPLMDFKEKYRLVIATPNAPARVWAATDDEYLQNIVTLVDAELARNKVKVKAFWLAGHSQGGMTSNRLVRTDFFKQRVNGWVSLSGGRLGPTPPIPASFFAGARGGAAPGGASGATPPAPGRGAAFAALREPPAADFSFIFETGQHELGDQPIPEESTWAKKYACGPRTRLKDVIDTRPGYVYDGTRQNPGSEAWGHLPRPGSAEVFEYSKCKDGRVVADIVRMGKGHTEGLEPNVTEQIVKLMLSAK